MILAATVGADARLRLFCGFPLPDAPAREVERWQQDELASVVGVRVVPREYLHFTDAFLGSRPASDVPRIAEALREASAGAARPRYVLRGYRETRSVGMLVFDGPSDIAEGVQRRLGTLGVYEPERRPWLPHVTVLRFRRPPRLAPELPGLGEVSLSDLALYNSVLRSTGAQYEILESFALGG